MYVKKKKNHSDVAGSTLTKHKYFHYLVSFKCRYHKADNSILGDSF